MSSSDAVLHRRAETLYAEHHSWLAGWLRHRMGGEDVAADLAQDTFLRVLTSRELPLLLEPRAFLATIARRLMANHYRREAIERAYLEILATLPEARMPSPEDRRLVLEALCAIDRALDNLPANAREAFLLGPSLTGVLTRMERDGLIARERCSQDARRTVVRATPAGLKLVRKLSATIEAHYAWLEERLSKARLAQLYVLLDEVIALEGDVDDNLDEEAA